MCVRSFFLLYRLSDVLFVLLQEKKLFEIYVNYNFCGYANKQSIPIKIITTSKIIQICMPAFKENNLICKNVLIQLLFEKEFVILCVMFYFWLKFNKWERR